MLNICFVDLMLICGRIVFKLGYSIFVEVLCLEIFIVLLVREGFVELKLLLEGI